MTEICYYENEKRDMQEHTSLIATTSYKNWWLTELSFLLLFNRSACQAYERLFFIVFRCFKDTENQ